jgi:DNA-binding response OmpR family regulator
MDKQILIVDDSLTVRSDLQEAFEEAGVAVLACSSAGEARAALDADHIGLMVLDVQLPDADGVNFLREIRADRRHATLPVLMLSSEADVRDRIRGLMTGSNEYVGKPYDRDYIVLRAQELMRERDRGDEAPIRASVLLIDDSRTFRERLGELLREQRFAVRFAETGEEGLKSAAMFRPAAVVVDGELPGIDGATVIRKLRLDAVLRDTTCILLTGSEDRGAELRALDAGADAFVTKGNDIGVVLARVTAALRNVSRSAHGKTASLHAAKRILAVDDSMTYLHTLHDILGGEGYDVILAHSGEEALDMLAVQSVDCILLDRLMPGMGGTEACRVLKSSPGTRDIPLIMLTAMEDREAMIEGLGTGADDYVLKSSELDVLKARVRAQLRRKQFEDESQRIRTELMNKELEAAEARAARELAQSRAELLAILEQKNLDLQEVNSQLTERQAEIAEKNLQLEEASRMKSEFLSNMSHELRTPLNAIIGFSEVLKDGMFGELTPRQKEYIGEVFSSGQHLLALINDILDLSKVEAGMMTLDPSVIDVNELLDNTLGIVRERALKAQVSLDFSRCAKPPYDGKLLTDARKLKQIVYNMLSNAVKFSSPGGLVLLELQAVPRSAVALRPEPGMASRMLDAPPGETELFLQVRVSDEGLGIAEADLPNLFQSFRQLGDSLTRQHEGTGLGLVLVMRLAELHGGTVGVESAPGKGTRFTVWLPWRNSPEMA